MSKQKIKKLFGIVLYVVAGLLLVYAIWSFAYCADIISDAKASGQLATSGNEYDIISFYMGNCAQYLVYALLLVTGGLLLLKKEIAQGQTIDIATIPTQKNSENDNELDEWFEETNE